MIEADVAARSAADRGAGTRTARVGRTEPHRTSVRPSSGAEVTRRDPSGRRAPRRWSRGPPPERRPGCLIVAPEPPQQVCPGRVEQVVLVKVESVEDGQRRPGPSDLGQGDGPVHGDDGRWRHRQQLVVQGEDLAPVGRLDRGGVGVDRVDRGLDLVRARAGCGGGRRARSRGPPRSARGPTTAGPGRGAGRGSRLPANRAAQRDSVNSRSASSPATSASSGIRPAHRASQPDGLLAQVVAGGPAGARVVGQVEDGQHRTEPLRQLRLGRHAVRDVGRLDLVLCPDEPLGHRRLGDQEGARHLGGREATEQPQRQRDLRLGREGRVAAGEDRAGVGRPPRARPPLRRCAVGSSTSRCARSSRPRDSRRR